MNISAFDLNLLRVLDALLRDGSTVKAADRLGMSQPAVSAALGRLRHALGDALFVRKGQGIEPTLVARDLATPVRDILDRVEAVLAGPAAFRPERTNLSFKIGGSDAIGELLMPPLLKRLQTEAPGARVQLVDLVPDNSAQTLEREGVDLALIPGLRDFPEWVERRLAYRAPYSVIAAAGHVALTEARLAEGDTVPLDLFCTLGHVLFAPDGKLSGVGDTALSELGRRRRIVASLPSFAGVARTVAASEAVALMPNPLAEVFRDRYGLAIYQPPMPVPGTPVYMCWHARATSSPGQSWMRDMIFDIFAPLRERTIRQSA